MAKEYVEDAVVVPTGSEGNFEKMFCNGYWHTLKITKVAVIKQLASMRDGIFVPSVLKYIYAYESAPRSAITMKAEINVLCQNRHDEEGQRYHVYFKARPDEIPHVPMGVKGGVKLPLFTSSKLIDGANSVDDLFNV